MLSYVGRMFLLQQLNAPKDSHSHQYTRIYVRKHTYEQFRHNEGGGVFSVNYM